MVHPEELEAIGKLGKNAKAVISKGDTFVDSQVSRLFQMDATSKQ